MSLLKKITVGAMALALLVPAAAGAVTINEIRIDQPGTDTDEYFELTGNEGESLDGITYLVIGDGSGASGVVEMALDLSGNAIPVGGYFLAGENATVLGVTADLVASLAFENSDNVTHMLVRDFFGAAGDDLDTDDDCVLDTEPWSQVIDKIALIEEENPPTGTECHYGPPTIGPDGTFVPGHVFVCNGTWYVGQFDPAGGLDTPRAANTPSCSVVPTDETSWGSMKSRF